MKNVQNQKKSLDGTLCIWYVITNVKCIAWFPPLRQVPSNPPPPCGQNLFELSHFFFLPNPKPNVNTNAVLDPEPDPVPDTDPDPGPHPIRTLTLALTPTFEPSNHQTSTLKPAISKWPQPRNKMVVCTRYNAPPSPTPHPPTHPLQFRVSVFHSLNRPGRRRRFEKSDGRYHPMDRVRKGVFHFILCWFLVVLF